MQYWIKIIKTALFLLVFFTVTNTAQAQENSPYSRYGLGNLKQSENVYYRGMGGVSYADANTLVTNSMNPASYASLKMTSYQIGFEGTTVNIKNATSSNKVGKASLSYLTIGFPISKKMGISFGLQPQTRSYYQMQDVTTNTQFADVTKTYSGGGGLQKVYVGTAYKIKGLSVGINAGYSFGSIANISETEFTDSTRIISSYYRKDYSMGGLFWQLGTIYTHKLKDEISLNIGATYTGSQTLNAKRNSRYESREVYSGFSYVVDSIENVKGKIKLPADFGAGIMLKNGDYWQVGVDYNASNWSSFTNYGAKDSTTNAWQLKVGGAFTPDVNSTTNQLKRMTYRAGFNVGKDIFSFNGNTLSKFTGTVGIGYPIRRTNLSIGQLNAAIEVGKRGTTNNGMIKESFSRLVIGVTLNDKWFIKRKYD